MGEGFSGGGFSCDVTKGTDTSLVPNCCRKCTQNILFSGDFYDCIFMIICTLQGFILTLHFFICSLKMLINDIEHLQNVSLLSFAVLLQYKDLVETEKINALMQTLVPH